MGITLTFSRAHTVNNDTKTKVKINPTVPKAKVRFGPGGCNCGKKK